jgi:hypothetical protein
MTGLRLQTRKPVLPVGNTEPLLRLVHTLGGCGGTLLSRCLAVLPRVALLSEVNPGSVKLFPEFDPLHQDAQNLHLLSPDDHQRFSTMDLSRPQNFLALIEVMFERAVASERHLVIRDYNYVEFIGPPYRDDPPRRLLLREALPAAIPTAAVALVRHPIDQWFSLCKHVRVASVLTPALFCDAYLAFLRELGTTPVFRYEDFVAEPERQLRAMCLDLRLPFVSSFRVRFHKFDGVTGDFTRLRDTSISFPASKSPAPEILDKFRACPSYQAVLAQTGYRDSRAA